MSFHFICLFAPTDAQEFDLNLNWVKNGPPRSGILSLTYYTPPGCARPEARIEIAEDFCGWEFAVEDDPDNPMSPRSRRCVIRDSVSITLD